MVPLDLQYAATALRPSGHIPTVVPPHLGSFGPMHPAMLQDQLCAGVVRMGNSQPDSFSNMIPVFHILKENDELITLWNAKYINDTNNIIPLHFSIYHFHALNKILSQYYREGRTPLFSKHDWRKFYPSLRLGRQLSAGILLDGRVQELVTDRAVFGRSTEPAIGQAVNQTLWRERPRADPSVHCLQILDDTLCVHWHKPTLCTNFDSFRSIGKANDLIEHEGKLLEAVPECVFCGKSVSARGVSHPPDLWAKSTLKILCMAAECRKKKHMQIILGNVNWLAGHGNLARPFLLPLYHLLHHSRLRHIPAGYVTRCLHAALALAAIPKNVTWGLELGVPVPGTQICYVDAAHDYGLACLVIVTADGQGTMVQTAVPMPYTATQQKAERWALYWAMATLCRLRIQPQALCADNMGSILADFTASAPSADWLLVRLAQKMSRLMVRHFPQLTLSHVLGILNPADLGTRRIFAALDTMITAPDCVLDKHQSSDLYVIRFYRPHCFDEVKGIISLFPSWGSILETTPRISFAKHMSSCPQIL